MWCPGICKWSFEFPPISLSCLRMMMSAQLFFVKFYFSPWTFDFVFWPLIPTIEIFYLFQFHPLIEIDYILKFQFGPHAFNFAGWVGILNIFCFKVLIWFQLHPSMQIYDKSLIFLASKFDFFQFYPSIQVNYGF